MRAVRFQWVNFFPNILSILNFEIVRTCISANLLNSTDWLVTIDEDEDAKEEVVWEALWSKRSTKVRSPVRNDTATGASTDLTTDKNRVIIQL